MLEWLGLVGGIVLVDLALSSDNALVIGAAAAGLPKRQRLLAIMLGGGGAIVLRIVFAIVATLLLQLPLLRAIGAVVLLVIAVRLLMERDQKTQEHEESVKDAPPGKNRSFLSAILTILVADVTMSLDNVLAVGALAEGHVVILAVGVLFSIVILLVGSALVATLIERVPLLLDFASLVLGWAAGSMLIEDLQVGPVIEQSIPWSQYSIPALCVLLVLVADIYLRWRAKQAIGRSADK